MPNVEEQLASFGLNEKEIKVYLACLQLGTDTVFNIAEKSGVKRATTYLVLRSLVRKALVTSSGTAKSVLFSATSPQNLLLQLEYRKKDIEQILPSLMALHNAQPDKPKIETFEGSGGVKQIYQEMIEYAQKGQEILLYGDTSYFTNHPGLFNAWLMGTRNTQGTIREILNDDEANRNYREAVEKNSNPRHMIRLVDRAVGTFLNDNIIFGGKVAIFSIQKHMFATVLQSKEIAASYRTIFNLAWSRV